MRMSLELFGVRRIVGGRQVLPTDTALPCFRCEFHAEEQEHRDRSRNRD